MKRFLTVLLCAALLLTLTACSRAAGGAYKLEYITADGMRFAPSSFGMNITFELDSDGVGTANYSGTVVDITWSDEGGTVTVSGGGRELEFTKDGKRLILHDEGAMLFFSPIEDEED